MRRCARRVRASTTSAIPWRSVRSAFFRLTLCLPGMVVPLSNVGGRTSNGFVLPGRPCAASAAGRHPGPGNTGLPEAGEASLDEGRASSAFSPALGPWKIIEAGRRVLAYAKRWIGVSTHGRRGNLCWLGGWIMDDGGPLHSRHEDESERGACGIPPTTPPLLPLWHASGEGQRRAPVRPLPACLP